MIFPQVNRLEKNSRKLLKTLDYYSSMMYT
nr:MAG TPA: hypothetical protein [Caudoviricetes sp.]